MGRKKIIIFIGIIVFLFVIAGCGNVIQEIDLYGVKFSKVKASLNYAYFLDINGVLYSTGADTDASAYVAFKNKEKGIVAENVRDFGTMLCGGYYIDNNDDLYLWNRDDIPLYNYQKGSSKCVLNNVRNVLFTKKYMLYIDAKNNLFIAGEFGDERYNINNPKQLGSNVLSVGADEGFLLWCQSDGVIKSIGESSLDIDSINDCFGSKPIQDIVVNNGYILLLTDGELWFYGNYENFKYRKNVSDDAADFMLLTTGVTEVVGAYSSIIALDLDGNVKLWGKCLYDWDFENNEPQYKYVDDYILAKKGKSVYITDGCITYVDEQYHSKIYYEDGWCSWYGNSTRDRYIGIRQEPITWVR